MFYAILISSIPFEVFRWKVFKRAPCIYVHTYRFIEFGDEYPEGKVAHRCSRSRLSELFSTFSPPFRPVGSARPFPTVRMSLFLSSAHTYRHSLALFHFRLPRSPPSVSFCSRYFFRAGSLVSTVPALRFRATVVTVAKVCVTVPRYDRYTDRVIEFVAEVARAKCRLVKNRTTVTTPRFTEITDRTVRSS